MSATDEAARIAEIQHKAGRGIVLFLATALDLAGWINHKSPAAEDISKRGCGNRVGYGRPTRGILYETHLDGTQLGEGAGNNLRKQSRSTERGASAYSADLWWPLGAIDNTAVPIELDMDEGDGTFPRHRIFRKCPSHDRRVICPNWLAVLTDRRFEMGVGQNGVAGSNIKLLRPGGVQDAASIRFTVHIDFYSERNIALSSVGHRFGRIIIRAYPVAGLDRNSGCARAYCRCGQQKRQHNQEPAPGICGGEQIVGVASQSTSSSNGSCSDAFRVAPGISSAMFDMLLLKFGMT